MSTTLYSFLGVEECVVHIYDKYADEGVLPEKRFVQVNCLALRWRSRIDAIERT